MYIDGINQTAMLAVGTTERLNRLTDQQRKRIHLQLSVWAERIQAQRITDSMYCNALDKLYPKT